MAQVRPRAAVLATIGALGVAASAYFEWMGSDTARVIPLRKLLFVSNAGDNPTYWMSMAAPLVVVGAVGVLGALLLSRLVLLISFLLGLATAGLWLTTEILDKDGGGFAIRDVGVGGWIMIGALLVTLVGLIALRGRSFEEEEEEDDLPYGASSLARTLGSDATASTTKIGPSSSTLSGSGSSYGSSSSGSSLGTSTSSLGGSSGSSTYGSGSSGSGSSGSSYGSTSSPSTSL